MQRQVNAPTVSHCTVPACSPLQKAHCLHLLSRDMLSAILFRVGKFLFLIPNLKPMSPGFAPGEVTSTAVPA